MPNYVIQSGDSPSKIAKKNNTIMKRSKKLKYDMGGEMPYQPVGLPVNPATIRDAKKEQSDFTKVMDITTKAVGTLLPMVMPMLGKSAIAGNLAGKLGPQIDYVPTTPQPRVDNLVAYGGPIVIGKDTTGIPNVVPTPQLQSNMPTTNVYTNSYINTNGPSSKNKSQARFYTKATGGQLYAEGGPITPNLQKVGDVTFDSNKVRKGKYGNYIAKDIKTGKDYGVIRKEDGTYDFYLGNPSGLTADAPYKPLGSEYNAERSPIRSSIISLPKIDSQGYLVDGEGKKLPQPKSSTFDMQGSTMRIVRTMQADVPNKLHRWGDYPKILGRSVNPEYIADKESSAWGYSDFLKGKSVVKDLGGNYAVVKSGNTNYLQRPDGQSRVIQGGELEELLTGDLSAPRYQVSFPTGLEANASGIVHRRAGYATGGTTGTLIPYLAQGGDIPLSSDAMQVKGNPQVTDGNAYQMGDQNVRLDHNEVVTNAQDGTKFVFSTKLKDPITGKPFSKLAAVHERSKGKAEKVLDVNPRDEQAKSTISQANTILNALSNAQEALATQMGHRNPDGSTVQRHATGGVVQGDPQGIAPGFKPDPKHFQEWYNSRVQDPANRIRVTGKMDAKTIAAWNATNKEYAKSTGILYNQDKQLDHYGVTATGTGISVPGEDGYTSTALTIDPYTGETVSTAQKGVYPSQTLNSLPMMRNGKEIGFREVINPNANLMTDSLYSTQMYDKNNPIGAVKLPASFTANAAEASKTAVNKFAPPGTDSNKPYETPYTFGDTLKFTELLGKFAGLQGGPEKQKMRLDSTNITKASYDPAGQLYQSQKGFNALSNSINAPSASLRRSVLSSAYGTMLNQNSQILGQYDQMNQNAKVDYQNRLSGQNRFNSQVATTIDNYNAANRGAYDQATQNIFTSVGQFGEDLNRKQYGTDVINMLAKRYPDVFADVISAMKNGKKDGE